MSDEALHATHATRLDYLEQNTDTIWKAVESIREKLGKINTTVASLGVVNTLILGWIAWKLTKGI